MYEINKCKNNFFVSMIFTFYILLLYYFAIGIFANFISLILFLSCSHPILNYYKFILSYSMKFIHLSILGIRIRNYFIIYFWVALIVKTAMSFFKLSVLKTNYLDTINKNLFHNISKLKKKKNKYSLKYE